MTDSTRSSVTRSSEMIAVGLFLTRFGEVNGASRVLPPAELKTQEWHRAYMLFWKSLADGRTPRTFRNSLKNSRDGFDAWLNSGRRGWRDSSGNPRQFSELEKAVWHRWAFASREDFWGFIVEYTQFEVLQVSRRQLDDVDVLCAGGEQSTARTEGGLTHALRSEYERDPVLRAQAIEIHGLDCKACGFNFERKYGVHGAGFAEVHHSIPLSQGQERESDPASDLVVLCANCHRMVHRKWGEVLSIEELRSKLDKR